MDKKDIEKIKKEVASKIGKTIETAWGPSLVVGIIENETGVYVHLKEFGTEDYHVKIEDWWHI